VSPLAAKTIPVTRGATKNIRQQNKAIAITAPSPPPRSLSPFSSVDVPGLSGMEIWTDSKRISMILMIEYLGRKQFYL
jgi:hypothetical protein